MGEFFSKLFPDVTAFPGHTGGFSGFGFIQLLIVGFFYAMVLKDGSSLISDGSELLLLVPSMASLVGSIVLPILGAIPDGAMVLFSGLGDNAQEELLVGVGALAGSTIMLLTIPWGLSIIAGRVNIDNKGQGSYMKPKNLKISEWNKLNPQNNWSLMGTGVNCKPIIGWNALIMIVTCLSYIIIQGPAFGLSCWGQDRSKCKVEGEKWWAFVGILLCLLFFIGYLYYQMRMSNNEQAQVYQDEITKKAIEDGEISLSGAFLARIQELKQIETTSDTNLLEQQHNQSRLDNILKTFFCRYDRDNSGSIDVLELQTLMLDMGENLSSAELRDIATKMDKDQNGSIDFEEFCNNIHFLLEKRLTRVSQKGLEPFHLSEILDENEDEKHQVKRLEMEMEDEEEEEEDIPEDLASLSFEEQQKQIKIRAFFKMFIGTILVFLFSDPMVGVLNELSVRIKIPSFYIAFLLAPLASNASEIIAAYNYALKKTKKTITVSFSTLLGAACLNNTFCLGIFLCLVFFRGLAWEFSAETISILFIELIMFFFARRETHYLRDAIIIISLLPLSLVLVVVLEAVGLN